MTDKTGFTAFKMPVITAVISLPTLDQLKCPPNMALNTVSKACCNSPSTGFAAFKIAPKLMPFKIAKIRFTLLLTIEIAKLRAFLMLLAMPCQLIFLSEFAILSPNSLKSLALLFFLPASISNRSPK